VAVTYDAVVIGSGPNGLAAAIAIARAGLAVLVVEAHDTPGGGMRSAPLTEPGFCHDVCSSVHPLGVASPWFRRLGLDQHGLEWVDPPACLAHVLPDGRAVLLKRSLADTAAELGADGPAYTRLMEPFVERLDELFAMILGPLQFPRHPALFARFGIEASRSLQGLARARFAEAAAPALLGGIAAHAMVPLDETATASFALVLALAGHGAGWPIARGGSQAICDALVATFTALGGKIETGHRVRTLAELPQARAYVFDTAPTGLLEICGDRLPARYRSRVEKFRYGPGVFKMDWALREPVPWRDPACRQAATVHLSGRLEDIMAAQGEVHRGGVPQRPFILFGQPTLFDPSRAPAGRHTAWAYCHVPNGCEVDMTAAIEAHVEAFAPGFRDCVIARATVSPGQLEAYDANYVGGDINGGLSDWRQLFFRPVLRRDPYATPAPDIFICSSSTPPGGGVHGMCGYWAAASVLERVFGYPWP
jgi:phytoene dehydrogenase-like protein